MHNDGDLNSERPFHLGIASFRYDPETINRMLRYLEVPWEGGRIEAITDEELSAVDTVFLLNPTYDDSEWDVVFRHMDAGGTVINLLTPSLTAHTESTGVLARLGLRMQYTRPVKKLNLIYSEGYPVSHKRAKGDFMLCQERQRFVTFGSIDSQNQHLPLINAERFLSRPCVVMQVNYGRGAIVFSNSASLPEDRADIVTYLLKMAAARKPFIERKPAVPSSDEVFRTITSLFEVYDEIPLDVLGRKLAELSVELDRFALLSEIEKSIRSGELPAKIRGDTIVKAW